MIAIVSIKWNKHFISSPLCRPRILTRTVVEYPDGSGFRAEYVPWWLKIMLDAVGYGHGYSLYVSILNNTKPRRQWSHEALARNRLRKLRNRITKRYPLFAELFIADAIAKRPSYYAGVRCIATANREVRDELAEFLDGYDVDYKWT